MFRRLCATSEREKNAVVLPFKLSRTASRLPLPRYLAPRCFIQLKKFKPKALTRTMPKQNFYAVRKGREVGIFLTWADCEAQIKQYPGAVFKKFSTAAEAEAFVKGEPSNPVAAQSLGSTGDKPKGQKRTFASVADESQWIVVYSDGACKGNGQAGSVAGIGVYWGPNDPRNIAERCPGDQTNNRAELIAIIRVLETVPVNKKKLLIKTDSQYSINCFERWLPKWQGNSFQTASGSPVKNVGIIKYLSALLEERGRRGQQIRLQYVKGHSGDPGNDGADAQANIGATLPPRPDLDWKSLEARAGETIAALVETQTDQRTTVQKAEARGSTESLTERPAKISKSLNSKFTESSIPLYSPSKSLSKSRAPAPVSSPTRPPRSPFRPAIAGVNAKRSTIYQKSVHQADTDVSGTPEALVPQAPAVVPRPQTPPLHSSDFQATDVHHQSLPPQGPSDYDRHQATKESAKPSTSPRSPLKVSKVAPPLVPVSTSEIDFDMYKDCLLDGEDWAKEIEDL